MKPIIGDLVHLDITWGIILYLDIMPTGYDLAHYNLPVHQKHRNAVYRPVTVDLVHPDITCVFASYLGTRIGDLVH